MINLLPLAYNSIVFFLKVQWRRNQRRAYHSHRQTPTFLRLFIQKLKPITDVPSNLKKKLRLKVLPRWWRIQSIFSVCLPFNPFLIYLYFFIYVPQKREQWSRWKMVYGDKNVPHGRCQNGVWILITRMTITIRTKYEYGDPREKPRENGIVKNLRPSPKNWR